MKLHILQKTHLLILSLLISVNCYSQETLNILKNRIGVTIRGEFVEAYNANDFYIPNDPSSGVGLELGAFYKRKWGKRFGFLTELTFRYREFTMAYSVSNQNFSSNNIKLRSVFEMDWKLLTLTPSVGLRYYYYKKHKLYIEISGGIDYRLNAAPKQEYKMTAAYDDRELTDVLYIATDERRKRNLVILTSRVYTRMEFGLGIEIDDIDVGLFHRREITNSIGIRVKYSLLKR